MQSCDLFLGVRVCATATAEPRTVEESDISTALISVTLDMHTRWMGYFYRYLSIDVMFVSLVEDI